MHHIMKPQFTKIMVEPHIAEIMKQKGLWAEEIHVVKSGVDPISWDNI